MSDLCLNKKHLNENKRFSLLEIIFKKTLFLFFNILFNFKSLISVKKKFFFFLKRKYKTYVTNRNNNICRRNTIKKRSICAGVLFLLLL